MDNSNSASDEVKSLALGGNFEEIENKFGRKKCGKAENYVEVKLVSLKEKLQQNQPIDGIAYATPFMLFAAKSSNKNVSFTVAPFQFRPYQNIYRNNLPFTGSGNCGRI